MLSLGRRVIALMAFLVGVFASVASSHGHALQPGYLELRLINEELYAVVWKKPAIKSRPMAISAQLPESCEVRTRGDRGRTGRIPL